MRNRSRSRLLVIGVGQPIFWIIAETNLKVDPVSAAKISVFVPRSLRSLCFNLTSFGYRKLRFLDRESSIPSAGDFVTSRMTASCSHLVRTFVATLRVAPFSRSPARHFLQKVSWLRMKVTSWPVTYTNHDLLPKVRFGLCAQNSSKVNGDFHSGFGNPLVRLKWNGIASRVGVHAD